MGTGARRRTEWSVSRHMLERLNGAAKVAVATIGHCGHHEHKEKDNHRFHRGTSQREKKVSLCV